MSHNPPMDPGRETPDPEDLPESGDGEGTSGAGEPTESLETSPYGESDGDDTGDVSATPDYGRAPQPSANPWSEASDDSAEAGSEGDGAESSLSQEEGERPRRRDAAKRSAGSPVLWLVLAAAAVALGVAVYFAIRVFGGSDADPAPGGETTTAAEQATEAGEEPTDEPGEEATDAEATEEPTEETTEEETEGTDSAEQSELLRRLDVPVEFERGEETFVFDVDSDGFVEDSDVVDDGALEAYRATFADEDGNEIELFAAYYGDDDEANDAAQALAEELVDGLDGAAEADSGDTYVDGSGTYWAHLLNDGSGSYTWTTDLGHALQVTGNIEYLADFFNALRL